MPGTEITCHSRPGLGSVFAFRLPLADRPRKEEPGQIIENAVPTALASCLDGRHIAVIDDDSMVNKAVWISLESLGMNISTYGSAEEALTDSGIAGADFYISDLRLPGANGIELLNMIQRRVTRRIRAVLLSAETALDQIEMTQSTSWPVLFKLVNLPTLLAAMESQNAMR